MLNSSRWHIQVLIFTSPLLQCSCQHRSTEHTTYCAVQTLQSATETKVVLRSFCQLESGFADRRVQRIEDTLSTVDPGRLSVDSEARTSSAAHKASWVPGRYAVPGRTPGCRWSAISASTRLIRRAAATALSQVREPTSPCSRCASTNDFPPEQTDMLVAGKPVGFTSANTLSPRKRQPLFSGE